MCNAINISYSHRFLILTRIHFKLTLLTLTLGTLALMFGKLLQGSNRVCCKYKITRLAVFFLCWQILDFKPISREVWEIYSFSGYNPLKGFFRFQIINSHWIKTSQEKNSFKIMVWYCRPSSWYQEAGLIYLLLTGHPSSVSTGRQGSA